MPLREIRSLYEKRRQDLVHMLKNKKITKEREHQITGAIQEIDMFLKTLEHYRRREIEEGKKIMNSASGEKWYDTNNHRQ